MKKENINTANLDMSSTTPIACEACGNETFKPIFFLRKISRFLTGEDTDRVLPIDSLACVKCNNVNKEFNPTPPTPPTVKNKKENE